MTMTDFSETFRPIKTEYEDSAQFTSPELIYTTAGARLYRARKAGKFFMLKTPKNNGGMFLDLLIREYELSIGFSHPHIINVYTYEPHTCIGPAIVMEYVDGRTLAEYLKEEPSKAARIRVFEQLLSAVGCLHKADIIHNDLKPQNILITRANNDVKLIDFGLSDNSTHYTLKQLGGTPRYASPELLAQEETDARSDIYSLGCIMRDLFGNRYARITQKCLQSDPNDRYDNIEALLQAWRRRHLPWKIFLGVCLAAVILLPSFFYYAGRQELSQLQQTTNQQLSQSHLVNQQLREELTATRQEINREKQLVDSLNADYDRQIKQRYQQTIQELRAVPFREFSFIPVTEFYRDTRKLGDQLTANIKDPSILSQLNSHFEFLRNQLQQDLYDLVNRKKMMDRQKMSEEEYQFYLNLMTQGKRFQPYQP